MDKIRQWQARFITLTAPLFPEQHIYARTIPVNQQFLLFGLFAIVFTLGASFFPADGFVGFDWVNVFAQGRISSFHPPWDYYILLLFNWPLLIGLSLAATCLAALKRARHPISLAMTLFSLPVLWTLFLGQLEGLVVLGLLALPWLTPLALMKPQISFFAFGARRSYAIGLLVVLLISFVIWGFWPARMLAVNSYYAEGRYPQDISIGWWGALIALPLFWFSRGDMDMLMLAGSFMTPHLIPYNLLPVAPALARLRPGMAVLAWFCSWLPFASNWLGPLGWWLGWLYVGLLWSNLAYDRYFAKRPTPTPVADPAAARV